MQTPPYLYISPQSQSTATRIVIVLPEIYGLNGFVRSVADRAAQDLNVVGAGLDHFYSIDETVHTIGYDEHAVGSKLKDEVTGEKYLDLLGQAIDYLVAAYPSIQDFVIIGFCFGGKLAYVSGVDKRISTIISFYGGASLAEGMYKGLSVIDALVAARHDDPDLRVLGVFGARDELIPDSDRIGIGSTLSDAHISHDLRVYDAGHAFFNQDRADRYVEPAAQVAWRDVRKFLGA